jgi:menaquinone-specific isochorismate synthase
MPVLPYRFSPAYDARELQSLFSSVSVRARQRGVAQLLSLSYPLDPTVDPLLLLQCNPFQNQPSAYWEQPSHQVAIAAIGQVEGACFSGDDRFLRARQWLTTQQTHLTQAGDRDRPFAGLHAFSAFSFTAHAAPPGYAPAMLIVPQLQVARHGPQGTWSFNCRIEPTTTLATFLAQWQRCEALVQRLSTLSLGKKHPSPTPPRLDPAHQFAPFTHAVQRALQAIERGQLSKIVIAHAVDLLGVQPFSVVAALDTLRHHHPDCYTFAIGNAQGHSFIGASPERLIRVRDRCLHTDALAGSAPRGDNPHRDRELAQQLLTSDKERREHDAVGDYIVAQLRDLGLDPVRSPRRLLQLRNIQHLWTPITAPIPPTLHPLDIVAQLHPTPAVAGVPMAVACDRLHDYETFDRGLYAAPIGWLDAAGNSEFIVGTRSALICDRQARLYGGAGIVAGSDPDRELREIQLKLQTMLNTLQS